MAKKKQTQKNDLKTNKRILSRSILETFNRNPLKPLNHKQISKKLEVSDSRTRQVIHEILTELASDGVLDEIYTGKYRLKNTAGSYVEGIVEIKSNGNAYVVCDELQEDVFISHRSLSTALHGDEVRVHLLAKRKNRKLEGEILEIVKRARHTFVGRLDVTKNYAFLVPDSSHHSFDIFIPPGKLKDGTSGQKAIAKITEWQPHTKNPIGEIVEVLGNPGENDVEMHAILAEFELPYKFPDAIHAEAEKIDAGITPEEIARRRDFRHITTFTIDPIDAKDFDDALSLQKLENGHWEVGVHIADVTHYVQTETIVDDEAYERATSVYLVDRVVPMLPERLSNFICSLRPNEEKLTYSAVFEIDDAGEIHNEWFGRTVINSDRRFAYEEAQERIETEQGDLASEILTLNSLAKKLRNKRFKNGAIAFERAEVRFNIDEKGKPLSVYFKQSKAANQLIEEFMLLANKKVAELIGSKKSEYYRKTFVYRVHDLPDPEKLGSFAKFIKRFGYTLKSSSSEIEVARSINTLLDEIVGKPEEDVISNLAVRAMAKAVYSPENIGHYGLAFDHYTHFTSPIRRYPDMMVHRLLNAYMQGKQSEHIEVYRKKCRHSSDMERKAAMAERASIKYKQVEFMQDKLGEVFEGIISGVTEWGMYVEIIENKIEGMIALRNMDDDFYVFDEDNYCIVGHRSHKRYTLGDKVMIQITKANLQKKQLDFMIYKEPK